MKRVFPCGHKGQGRYCHRCAKVDAAAPRAEATQHSKDTLIAAELAYLASFEKDIIDLTHFPPKVVFKTRLILAQLATGTDPCQLDGKRMESNRRRIAVPIGYRYRLMCDDVAGQIIPRRLLSHEDYNQITNH